jgi:gliding motility-associated transport system permease protein
VTAGGFWFVALYIVGALIVANLLMGFTAGMVSDDPSLFGKLLLGARWLIAAVSILILIGLPCLYVYLRFVQPDPRLTTDLEIVCGNDPSTVAATYLGLALAGAMFLALGMFVSSLVKSQMVAALIALFLGLIFIMVGFWRPDMDTSSPLYRTLFYFTVPLHFENNFSRGRVDTRQLVLYASVALFCFFLTIRSVESRRWR